MCIRDSQLRAVDTRIRESMLDAMQLVLSGTAEDDPRVEALRMENAQLQMLRAETLGRLGLPADYTDEGYMCPKCRDTGYLGTGLCDCLKKLYIQEQKKELSSLLKLGEQTFDAFDLDWYCLLYTSGFCSQWATCRLRRRWRFTPRWCAWG